MSALTVDLPDDLHVKAQEVAASKNLSRDALATIALTKAYLAWSRSRPWSSAPLGQLAKA
jgi:predicted transcriptional regulator